MTPEGLRELGSGRLSFVRKQDARNYRAGGGRDCDPQSDRTDHRWRNEDLWRGERQLIRPEGRAKAIADAIAEQLKIRFREQRLDQVESRTARLRVSVSRDSQTYKRRRSPVATAKMTSRC